MIFLTAGGVGGGDEKMGNLCNTVDILDIKFHNHREAARIKERGRERRTMDKLVLPEAAPVR